MSDSSGVIIKCKNKILLCKRSENNDYSGYWSPPMGGVEENESSLDAAKREFEEETNIKILGGLKKIAEIKEKNKKIYFYLKNTNKEINPNLKKAKDGFEHSECGYFNKVEIEGLKSSEKFKKVYEKILN
jgi:ADP-ribose pyrophosphatase YjhB (NUDIX family)